MNNSERKAKLNKTYNSPLKTKTFNVINSLSDRFIPYSISPNLKCDLISPSQSPNNIKVNKNTEVKSHSAYKKILFKELLQTSETPSSKRKINFSLSKSKKKSPSPSLLLSNEISNFANNTSLSKGKIKTVTPNKTILFSNPIDNFYFNVLDMYDISKIALGTRTSIHLYNANLNLPHVNSIEIDGEPLCVHFLSSTSLIHSSSNNDIIMTDLNKIKRYPLMTNHRPILAMDSNLSVIFCGDDNGIIESIDIRTNRNTQRKISILYSHERNNEICKIRYSQSNNCIISGGNDNRANLFDLRKNSIRFTMKHKAAVKGIAVNKDESKCATGGGTYDKKIKLWDIKKGTLQSEILTESQITNLEFLPGDSIISSFGFIGNNMILYQLNNELIQRHDISDSFFQKIGREDDSIEDDIVNIFEEKAHFESHSKRILFTAKDINDSYIASASNDGVMKIWNIERYSTKKNENLQCDNFLNSIR